MELYTSYWQNPDLAGRRDIIPVGISRISLTALTHKKVPYRFRMCLVLRPSREAFALYRSGEIEEFKMLYRADLEEVGPERIREELRRISTEHGGKPLVLLCFEQPGELCHRRLWADWWREKTGQEVPELPTHPTAYPPEPGFR